MHLDHDALLDALTRTVATGTLDAVDARLLSAARLQRFDARAAYDALLTRTWGDVIDDDALSDREVAALGAIVGALALPACCAPHRDRAVFAKAV